MLNCVFVTPGTLQYRRYIQTSDQLATGARETLERIVVFSETTLGQGEIVKNSLITGRKPGRPLQAIYCSAIVAVLVKREAKIIQGLSVFLDANSFFVSFFRTFPHAFAIVSDAQQVVSFAQPGIKGHRE